MLISPKSDNKASLNDITRNSHVTLIYVSELRDVSGNCKAETPERIDFTRITDNSLSKVQTIAYLRYSL